MEMPAGVACPNDMGYAFEFFGCDLFPLLQLAQQFFSFLVVDSAWACLSQPIANFVWTQVPRPYMLDKHRVLFLRMVRAVVVDIFALGIAFTAKKRPKIAGYRPEK